MLRRTVVLFFCIWASNTFAGPTVPSTMEFAGISLTIHESARRLIQDDVDALTRSQTYFLKKVEKAAIYFPIIERAFAAENTPEDFKYLIIQESAMVADAVSVSNAVGFWQFKEGTAREVGLRVDRYIDERMCITASTHAAAKYLKKNNFFFNNWVYALLAYNTGPGGAESFITKKYLGANKMEITKDTHWYIRKFLAHKIAFEEALKVYPAPDLVLFEYDEIQHKSLKDLANQFDVDYQDVVDYNKWLKHSKVPDDKRYVAVIPVTSSDATALNHFRPKNALEARTVAASKPHPESFQQPSNTAFNENSEFPVIVRKNASKDVRINGIPGFIATPDDNLITSPDKHKISRAQFLQYNDMMASDLIKPGQVYYLRSKKTKARVHHHVTLPGETTWSISQKFGIKLQRLLMKNRMAITEQPSEGMVLWLRFIRPSDVPVEYRKVNATNVIVQSYPNNIDIKPLPPAVVKSKDPEPVKAPVSSAPDESEFLFEEVGENSGYVGDNSFVDLTEPPKNDNQTAAPVPAKSNRPDAVTYHTVSPGETLFAIARIYNVSIGELRQWNNFDDLNVLKPGQRIAIGQSSQMSTSELPQQSVGSQSSHQVQKEDTLYSIARKYGLTIQELMELNDKKDFNIKEGELLKVSKSR
ncbi:MAG: LysM peptidoglycan-binding domain-containing protein [Cyclobacteriaceae bacterium]|nr:LysM peptidoglycan-binding domain-containing protein [Cyclobacteriaceae bacterium]